MATAKPSRQRGLNQEFPKRLADDFARRFGRMNEVALDIIRRRLVPAIAAGSEAEIFAAIDAIEAELSRRFPDNDIRDAAREAGDLLNDRNRRLFFSGLAAAVGVKLLGSDAPGTEIDLPRIPAGVEPTPRRRRRLVVRLNLEPNLLVDNFVDENIRLISTLRSGVVEGVGDQVSRAVLLQGPPLEGLDLGPNPTRQEVADRLLAAWERKGVPSRIPIRRMRRDGTPVLITLENHARLIARDQISKLNGQLARARQTAAGITSFVWETQKDSRVRPEHRALQGRTFTWADGANGVFPGQPIQCRCWARAVVDADQVLSDGDFIDIDDPNFAGRDVFTERGQPGITPTNPGPGSRL